MATKEIVAEVWKYLADNCFVGELGGARGVGTSNFGTQAGLSVEATEALLRLAEIGAQHAIDLVGMLGV